MASGFSLGAAIGATGKFPKLKVNTVDEAGLDRKAKELASIRSRITTDQNKFHNAFIGEEAQETAETIQTLLTNETNKNPNVISEAYNAEILLGKNRAFRKNSSNALFDIEKQYEDAETKVNDYFITPSITKTYNIIKNATSRDEIRQKLAEDPSIFKDGYVYIDPKNPAALPTVLFHNEFDFAKEMNRRLKLSDHGVLINEKTKTTDKTNNISRYFSIPKDRAEAEFLRTTNPNIKVEDNAFDLGKTWFSQNPTAQLQYRALLAQNGDQNALDKDQVNFDELYNRFYKDNVLPNIPAKYENSDRVFTRINVSSNFGDQVAPTSFTIGDFTSNYSGTVNGLKSNTSVVVSKEPGGAVVSVPTNRFMVNMNTGTPQFETTTQKDFYVSTIAVFPTVIVRDKVTGIAFAKPVTEAQIAEVKAKGEKIMMLPFAIGNTQSFSSPSIPEFGKTGYLIPLFEPDANGRWVVPKDARQKKTVRGSRLLSAITSRSNWDKETQANWDEAYFTFMQAVQDQNDVTGKTAPAAKPAAKPAVKK